MNLKSLTMEKFGLFRNRKLEFCPGFNLIFGPNESGKTTLLDAIVLALLSRTDKKGAKLKGYPRALKPIRDRYGSEISLQMVVEHDAQELIFPAAESFHDLWGVGWDELRAIFIAREGDLELAKRETFPKWWNTLKGKLLGFEEEPKRVLKKIAEEAGLTDNLALTMVQREYREDIQKKLTWYEVNKERIHSLRRLKKDYQGLKLKEEELAREADKKKKGILKTRLLRANVIYSQLKSATEKLREEFARYDEQDLKEWERLERELEKELALLERLLLQKRQEEERHKQAVKDVAQMTHHLTAMMEKLRLVDDREVELTAAVHLEEKDSSRGIPHWIPWALWACAILALIFGLYSTPLLFILCGILVVRALSFTYKLRKAAAEETLLNRQRQKFLRWARDLDLKAESLTDLLLKLMDLRRNKDRLEGQRNQLQDQLPKLADTAGEVAKLKRSKEDAVEKIRGKIRQLRDKVGLSDLEQLRQRVQSKKELQSDVEKRYKSELRALLDSKEASWAGQLEELKSMEDVPPVEDNSQVEKITRGLENLRREQQGKYEQLTQLNAEIKAHFGVQTPEEVIWKVEDLQRELQEMKILKQAGQKVHQIFDRLLQRSDTVLDDIIGGKTVCAGFQQVTGDKYQAVTMEDLVLRATDAQGKTWDFQDLSTGTRDQLLTVLRLALAEKRLQGKGFLIFDDALVTSDRTRLREQMEMLGQLTQAGWQILFMTAQDEVRQEAERLAGLEMEVRIVDL